MKSKQSCARYIVFVDYCPIRKFLCIQFVMFIQSGSSIICSAGYQLFSDIPMTCPPAGGKEFQMAALYYKAICENELDCENRDVNQSHNLQLVTKYIFQSQGNYQILFSVFKFSYCLLSPYLRFQKYKQGHFESQLFYYTQECIPVWCVPPALWPYPVAVKILQITLK